MKAVANTVRMPPDLSLALEEYAKREDMSKNQVIKKAVRLLIEKAK